MDRQRLKRILAPAERIDNAKLEVFACAAGCDNVKNDAPYGKLFPQI
ncbi:hypothetical protein HMPREF9012_1382 [Bacteroidetes bacterium oral taxon 272 str. F0290]|nr:hypothetical protein HMPREF9012_1382 [Bacteroidetes bacterium oral taxon 272 str. F0290]